MNDAAMRTNDIFGNGVDCPKMLRFVQTELLYRYSGARNVINFLPQI